MAETHEQFLENSKVRILVAEDDTVFRQLICETLERRGFAVRAAENGLVAKTIYDLAPEDFELVVSDVRMPVLDGLALLSHIKKIGPQTKFLLMTGFAEAIEAKRALELGADEFLSKPFRASALVDAVRECMFPQPKEDPSDR